MAPCGSVAVETGEPPKTHRPPRRRARSSERAYARLAVALGPRRTALPVALNRAARLSALNVGQPGRQEPIGELVRHYAAIPARPVVPFSEAATALEDRLLAGTTSDESEPISTDPRQLNKPETRRAGQAREMYRFSPERLNQAVGPLFLPRTSTLDDLDSVRVTGRAGVPGKT